MARLDNTNLFQNVTQSNDKNQEKNKYYLNLGFQLKDGTFVRLSNSIVISVDKFMGEKKNLSANNEDWNNKQKLINRAIEELQQVFNQMQDGSTTMLTEYEDAKVLSKLTFQFSKADHNKTNTDAPIATDEDILNLL